MRTRCVLPRVRSVGLKADAGPIPTLPQGNGAGPSTKKSRKAEAKANRKALARKAQAPKEQSKDPGVLMAQLEQLRMMQKLPNLRESPLPFSAFLLDPLLNPSLLRSLRSTAEQARAKVDVAYLEVAQQLHYLQMVHAMTHTPQFNAFGQPQPLNPAMIPPPPVFTYGRSGHGGAAEAEPTAHLSDEEARRRLANGRRRGLKRKTADEEGNPPTPAAVSAPDPRPSKGDDPSAIESKDRQSPISGDGPAALITEDTMA